MIKAETPKVSWTSALQMSCMIGIQAHTMGRTATCKLQLALLLQQLQQMDVMPSIPHQQARRTLQEAPLDLGEPTALHGAPRVQ